MGGDNAPTETVAGAVEAAERGVEVVLVGNNAVLEAELAKHSRRLPIVNAPEVIEMSDDGRILCKRFLEEQHALQSAGHETGGPAA